MPFVKVLEFVMHLLLSRTLQAELERRREASLVKIEFSATLDRLNNVGACTKLRPLGVAGSQFTLVKQFVTNSQALYRG